jgi:putative transposase
MAPIALVHSDQGTQFTSWAFSHRAKASGLVPSTGSIGDCYDNAMIEAFWARMQVELLDRQRWTTRSHLRTRSSTTSRSSIIGSVVTVRFGCLHR